MPVVNKKFMFQRVYDGLPTSVIERVGVLCVRYWCCSWTKWILLLSFCACSNAYIYIFYFSSFCYCVLLYNFHIKYKPAVVPPRARWGSSQCCPCPRLLSWI